MRLPRSSHDLCACVRASTLVNATATSGLTFRHHVCDKSAAQSLGPTDWLRGTAALMKASLFPMSAHADRPTLTGREYLMDNSRLMLANTTQLPNEEDIGTLLVL